MRVFYNLATIFRLALAKRAGTGRITFPMRLGLAAAVPGDAPGGVAAPPRHLAGSPLDDRSQLSARCANEA
jgi:hypothetical protein